MIKFLDLHAQYKAIKGEIDAAIESVIADSAFVGGRYVRQFEEVFARYVGTDHCIGVGNGTDALEIILEALQLPQGSEIIVPANSFIATAEAVTRSNHQVVFADVDPTTYTISAETAKSKLSTRTSGVIAVHLYGQPCDMDPLQALCAERKVALIEDCAQAHGATYKGRNIGTFGAAAAFSFYPGKNLGAYGDGGAITSQDANLARRARMIANHGRVEKYDHDFEGRNSRLDGLQAAVLAVKLRHLEKWIRRRIEIADYYVRRLQYADELVLPKVPSWGRHVFHLFVIRVKQRNALREHLAKEGIETGIHYPIALPNLKAYRHLAASDANAFYSTSEQTLLSLPMGDHMTLDDAEAVCRSIEKFLGKDMTKDYSAKTSDIA